MLPILTIMHPLVDACSMSVLAVGGMTWSRILLYNVLAFALQLPLGVLIDACPRLAGRCFLFGTSLVCAATLMTACGCGGWGVLSAVCLGNAIFHLTAGKHVLETHDGRSGPIGIFISTGALGLLAGKVGVEHAAAACLPAFAVLLALCVVVVTARRGWMRVVLPLRNDEARLATRPSDGVWIVSLALAGLFALIAWRSWAGLAASRLTAAEGMALLLVSALATWSGKAAGGYLADCLGRWPVTIASVCGSVVLAIASSPENAVVWMLLLFVAQLATGPVLSFAYEWTDRKGGTAFGLNCLGLFAGSF